MEKLIHCVVLLLLCMLTLENVSAADIWFSKEAAPGWPGVSLKGIPCRGKGQGYGPYDYTNPDHYKYMLPIVEKKHFTRVVEKLISGQSNSLALHADLDYTLRAFPNHHRALYSVVRMGFLPEKSKLKSPIECYLQRAEKFKPLDGTVRVIHGIYLHRLGMHEKALSVYKKAEKLLPNSPELTYNMGLLYFNMGKYSKAVESARRAYSMGYTLSGLKRKLKSKGYSLNEPKN